MGPYPIRITAWNQLYVVYRAKLFSVNSAGKPAKLAIATYGKTGQNRQVPSDCNIKSATLQDLFAVPTTSTMPSMPFLCQPYLTLRSYRGFFQDSKVYNINIDCYHVVTVFPVIWVKVVWFVINRLKLCKIGSDNQWCRMATTWHCGHDHTDFSGTVQDYKMVMQSVGPGPITISLAVLCTSSPTVSLNEFTHNMVLHCTTKINGTICCQNLEWL